MTGPDPTPVGRSVRARLKRIAVAEARDVQSVLVRYANERFLYRLSVSPHRDQFVLKGASLFILWTGSPHRATRDIDLLGFGDSTDERLLSVFGDVLRADVADDGVEFDTESLAIAPIRDTQRYGGTHVELAARITSARVRLRVDVGFGDAVTPEPVTAEIPSLLDFGTPRLRVYPREAVVAEKLEAMVQLGLVTSRMKDFYDLALLARRFEFDGDTLTRAIRATFDRRGTTLPLDPPIAFVAAFRSDPTKHTQWSGFVRKSGVEDAGDLSDTLQAVAAFAMPPLLAASGTVPIPRHWPAAGPWS